MSAWTWTHIKVDAVDRERGLQYCDLAEKDMNSVWYYENYLKDQKTALSKWRKFKFKNKKYFIEECNVPESHFTEEYIEKEFNEHINDFIKLQEYINKYRNNEISFKQLVNDTKISYRLHCNIKEYNGEKYISQYGEIFRLRQYDTFDANLHTVEDLIDYLRSNKRQQFICDFAVNGSPYEGLTDALVKRIREHYGKIGDNNFIVNFG
jgi:predicted GIY-YIG superfamily endonuclease